MTKENPFTVPQGYFENARAAIYTKAEKIHHRRKKVTLTLSSLAAAIVIVIGAQWTYLSQSTNNLVSEAEIWNCIENYDIYLQLDYE